MSYSKQNFVSGDVLQAKQLNAMDNQVYENEREISKVKNTSETPVTSGKVWTSTEDSAGWADPKVSSVNGKTGTVNLSAKDVGALPENTQIPVVPTKVSGFENDAGYLTEHQDISGKVDKIKGKGLSTNDYDNEAKEKVGYVPKIIEDISSINRKLRFYANNSGKTTLSDSDNGRIQDMTLYGRSVQDGTPTPDAPVEIQSVVNPTVFIFGKNLVDNANIEGVTLLSTETRIPNISGISVIPAGTYILSVGFTDGTSSNDTVYLNVRDAQNNILKSFRCTIPLSIDENLRNVKYDIYANSNQAGKTIAYVQLERGMVSTPYTPFQTIQTASLPYTLNAIPVTSGGNYTDADGQQWICDEVDFARGKYIQRLTVLAFDGSADEGWFVNGPTGVGIYRVCCDKYNRVLNPSPNTESMANFLCSSFEKSTAGYTWWRKDDLCAVDKTANIYVVRTSFTSSDTAISDWLSYLIDHPMTIVAELAEPVETDLSEEAMAVYSTLRTYYPVTNVIVSSDQLDGLTSFFYHIFVTEGWRYVKKQIDDNFYQITKLREELSSFITRLQSGRIEDAELHLGFYLDENGDLCQKEE